MKRLGLGGGGVVPAGYVPPTFAYVAGYALLACLAPVALFLLFAAHNTLGLALARVFGADPGADGRFWSQFLFWFGTISIGAALVALGTYALIAIQRAVEQRRVLHAFPRVALLFVVPTLLVLGAQLVVVYR